MTDILLVINAGSSSIKFSVFSCLDLALIFHGEIQGILENPKLMVVDANKTQLLTKNLPANQSDHYQIALGALFDWLAELPSQFSLKAVGHRVVHGGSYFLGPTLISPEVNQKMASLNPLAPLHQPYNLKAIHIISALYPSLPQVACFDTTFHQTQEHLAILFALPRSLSDEGIRRYGFHGLSYEYIASVLPQYMPERAEGKVIVAHLGHGASLCAMQNRQSVTTSMGLTALDGLMMGTRCGSLDPGVILYLLQEKQFSIEQLTALLYLESGLLGVSGVSSDMRKLQSSDEPHAVEAVELFCYSAAKELAALCAVLQGCDAIVFTAGIGEHSALVRKKIIDRLSWLGIALDEKANDANATVISQPSSPIMVAVIPTNEEYVIAKQTLGYSCGASISSGRTN